MKKMLSFFLLSLFLTACNDAKEAEPVEEKETVVEKDDSVHLAMEIGEHEARIRLDDLIEIVEGEYDYDELHRSVTFSISDDSFYLVEGIPVLERNGEYIPSEDIYLIIENDELFLPTAFLTEGLGLEIDYKSEEVAFEWHGEAEKVGGGRPETFNFHEWGVEEVINHLSFLNTPLKEAEVSTIRSHLPGAERAYRNGYHEGIDWYGFASGGDIDLGTPVYGAGAGIVVRADHDYVEYSSPEERDRELAYTAEIGETPAYIFDRLRGRQVWIQYDNGVMLRFAHLSNIPDDIRVGTEVDEDTIIGYVGNSGTSGAVNQDLTELHLHLDILIYGELFWKPLSEDEVRKVLVEIF